MHKKKRVYYITRWVDSHNHALIDKDKRHFMRANRIITEEQKRVIANHLACGIPARAIYDFMARSTSGYKKIGFLRKDVKNYQFLLNKKAIGPGKAAVLQSWFRKQASRNAFYYDIQVDSDGAICSIFWADPIMRADYALFGDFVSFDTTYRTNKSYRPLGVFVDFNHHKTTCIFGGTLLYNESAATYKWLLETFLKCMKGKKPATFMTDLLGFKTPKFLPEFQAINKNDRNLKSTNKPEDRYKLYH
ncbi:hypothetical protein LIER_35299 [Lithospermum erythrorhizon]|uniref:MULE transposase domain-containing protein n=1 Tax=Lithospermum erythrorhizon TaxID=34254 RepID=A0AAV3NNE1_LITER